MDVKDLRYVVAAYEAGSFARADTTLGVGRSNVSLRIRNLERSLGAALFERGYRRVSATTKGEGLYQRAKDLIAAIEGIEEAVRDVPDRPDPTA